MMSVSYFNIIPSDFQRFSTKDELKRPLGLTSIDLSIQSYNSSHLNGGSFRVETSTEFATRVPDTHYPTGTRVLVTVNLVSD